MKMPDSEGDDLYLRDPKGIAEPWNPEKAKGLKKPEA